MINVSKRVVKKKSKKPKKAAVKIDMTIITNVKIVTCTREGQLTCFISPFVSLIYSINRMSFPLKKPLRGYVFLYHTPLVSKSQPRVVDFGITLCAGGFATMPKFTTGSSAKGACTKKPHRNAAEQLKICMKQIYPVCIFAKIGRAHV